MTKCKYNKNTKTVMAMENSFYQEIENHLTSYSAMVQVKLESFIYITVTILVTTIVTTFMNFPDFV